MTLYYLNPSGAYYMGEKKFFTLNESNAIIPQLLKHVPLIPELGSDLRNKYPDIKNAWEKHKDNGGSGQGTPYLWASTSAQADNE